MKQFFPTRIAEIIFGFTMAVFGVLNFKSAHDEGTMHNVPSYMPGSPTLWIYITGAAFLLIAIAIIINKYKRYACYGLVALLFVFFIMVHLPDLMVHKYNLYQPLKDLAIAMGAIMIANNASK